MSDATSALPPYDETAERAMLGALLIDPDVWPTVRPEPAWFWLERHRLLFDAIATARERGLVADMVTVASILEERDQLDAIGGPQTLGTLVAETPTSLHAVYYASVLRARATERAALSALLDGVRRIYSTDRGQPHAVTSTISSVISALRTLTSDHPRPQRLPEALVTVIEEAHDTSRQAIPTGLRAYDRLTGGLRPGNLTIVAARPGMGKSALALLWALQAAKRNITTLVHTLEMSAEECARRILAHETGIALTTLSLTTWSDDLIARAIAAIEDLADLPLWLDDQPRVSVDAIAANLDTLDDVRLLIVDYVQLLSSPSPLRESRQEELARASRALKTLARERRLAVVAVAQLNRAVEQRVSPYPTLSDLRDTGQLEQDADVVVFLHRDDQRYTEEEWARRFPSQPYPKGLADLIVAKHRHGPTA